MKLFITGGTGFLGKYLLEDLSSRFETIYVLSRNENVSVFEKYKNFVIVQGDISNLEIFKNIEIRTLIKNEITHIIHAAALYDLSATHEECYLQNVVGTQNIIRLIKSCKKIKFFYYISTIAVGDDKNFFLEENALPQRNVFSDHYSKTKYLAEKLVRDTNLTEFSTVVIIRPGIIVGNSQTGEYDKIDGPYYFLNVFRKNLKILSKIKFAPLSYNPRSTMPIIPVDHCARFIGLLIERETQSINIETYHLISSEIPSIQEFLNDILKLFELNIKFIPVPANFIHNTALKLLGIPKEVIPFMFSKVSYDKNRTNRALPEILESKYSQYKNVLLKK